MKKILLLGGSAQQVIAIETAKRLGLYTVLCDFLPDNPGQYVADKFYLLSTTDKEKMLEVAMAEKVDAVLAYASDPAAPTAAYVAEKLGLPGNPYRSVEILCNKDKFREFLASNGFNAPRAGGYSDIETAKADFCNFRLPVIIKPVDSSGSKGATVLHSDEGLDAALKFAFSFSRSQRIIIEEFIEKSHKYLIGGDIFIYEGKVIQWGLLNCHRDGNVNPLVPVGKSYPTLISEKELNAVKSTLSRMVETLKINSGAMNVELVVDKEGRVWPIDIGPRSGGNMIPDLLGLIFGSDVVEMSVKTAIGMPIEIKNTDTNPFYATHNLHTDKNGSFKGIKYSDKIKPFIVKECVYKSEGDSVEYFDNAAKALGIVFFKFPDSDTMNDMLENVNSHITIEIL